MIKLLPLFISSLFLGFNNTPSLNSNRSGNYLNFAQKGDGTYVVESLKDNTLNEYRLYQRYNIDEDIYEISEINVDLFDNIDHPFIIMVSRDLNLPSNEMFDNPNLIQINYTGSIEQWNALNLNVNVDVYSYEFDEGFINLWDDEVRPTSDSDICSMSKEKFKTIKEKYDSLNSEDRAYVNEYIDRANQSIEDTMEYLSKYYSDEQKNGDQVKKNLPQDMTIGIIVSVAIFSIFLNSRKLSIKGRYI